MKDHLAIRQKWILDWIEEYYSVDCLNQQFHEKYHAQFPKYKHKRTNWGAQPVNQAMRDLKLLAKCGIINESKIGLSSGNWTTGFPKWIFSYTKKN